jgi:hypothetical protein
METGVLCNNSLTIDHWVRRKSVHRLSLASVHHVTLRIWIYAKDHCKIPKHAIPPQLEVVNVVDHWLRTVRYNCTHIQKEK